MANGYWVKFEARRVTVNEHIPHGSSYSLTLHDRTNRRIIGFDNAHAIKSRRKTGPEK
ncbi:toxin-antitoxin system TumE family protein [Geothermobacter hydrogeniphilus]|uniref:toxin-antitoxin system TumE family protein n=1 Tax=Geothermobacter hydrogeniphilus TaxID=1969733 RepID=UPI0026BA2A9E